MTWWLGDVAGALIVTPLIVIWAAGPRPRDLGRRWSEAVLLGIGIFAAGQLVFGGWLPEWFGRYPIAFVTIPVLVWAGYRFEQAGAAAGVALLAASAIPGTLRGQGPFAVTNPNDSLLLLQAFLATMSVTVIVLAALVWDSKRGEEEREGLRVETARLFREAEAANRAKDEFLATLSHELRTPLNAMLGWATVLRTGKLDEATTARGLDAIERNSRIQAQLIDDLLDVSRIVSGKLRLELRPVALRPVIEAALEATQAGAHAKRIAVDLDLNADVHVLGDPHRLQQIVWNLLSNAIKFTPSGGRVEHPARIRWGEGHDHRARHRRRHQPGVPAVPVRSLSTGRDPARRAPTGVWVLAWPSSVSSWTCTQEASPLPATARVAAPRSPSHCPRWPGSQPKRGSRFRTMCL